MDKFGRVWNKLSAVRRSSLSLSGSDDLLDSDFVVDTKKVFEMFGEGHQTTHRSSTPKRTVARRGLPTAASASGYRTQSIGHSNLLTIEPSASAVREQSERSISDQIPPIASKTNNASKTVTTGEPLGKVADSSSDEKNLECPTVAATVPAVVVQQSAARTTTPSTKDQPDESSISEAYTPCRVTFYGLPRTRVRKADESSDSEQATALTSNNTVLATAQHLSPDDACSGDLDIKKNDESSGNTASTSNASESKHQSKRRSSLFVRRGSVTTEDLQTVVLEDVYDVYKQLGTGRFGFIELAEHKESKQKIALKFFPIPQTKQVDFIREYNYSYFLSPHPNIIDTYRGINQISDESAYFFVQEYSPCASLREAVENSSNGIGEAATKSVMSKVLAAIEFMHDEGLVHRNLKAENILTFDPQFNKVKVTDFGLTRKVGASVRYLEYVNSYHAPELCETVVNETLIVDRSIDVWALGILIYYCLKGRFAWQKATIMCKLYWEWEQWLKRKNLQLPKRWDGFSEKSLKLFRRTLNPRSKDRWPVKNISKYLMKEKLLKTTKSTDEA